MVVNYSIQQGLWSSAHLKWGSTCSLTDDNFYMNVDINQLVCVSHFSFDGGGREGLIKRVIFALVTKASRQWDNQDWKLQEEKTENPLLCFGGITRSSNVVGEVLCDYITNQNKKKNHFKSSFYSINRLFNYQLKECLGAPTKFTTQSCSWHLISHKTLNFISLSSPQFIRRSHTSSTFGCLNYAARCHLPGESVSRAISDTLGVHAAAQKK